MSVILRSASSRLAVVLLVLSVLLLSGCGQPTESTPEEPVVHLKALAVLYGRYAGAHRGQAPKSEEDFKKYIESLPEGDRTSLNVTDVNSIFTSPRDSQPYQVLYGIALPPPGPQGAPVVAYEQTGEGGERYVATSVGDVQLVDEQKFQQMKPK